MEPAFPIVLTSQEHALLGELVEIMGQIDSILLATVARLLNVNDATAREIMGSTRVENNVSIWKRVILSRFDSEELSQWTSEASTRIGNLSRIRNDFIHAIYTNDYVDDYVEPGYQTTTATRIRDGKSKSTSEIEAARDLAAMVSCLVAHIDYCTKAPADRGQSPWRERLGPLLQIRPQPPKGRHRGKGRQPPP